MELNFSEIYFDGYLWFCLGIVFFCGFTLGWFCRKGNIFWCAIGLLIFYPMVQFVMVVDTWFITIPFVVGFLVHTGKPIYRRIFSK